MRYDQGVPPPLDDPLWHRLRQQQARAEKLAETRTVLLARLIKQTARLWTSGQLTPTDLLGRYIELRDNHLPGFERQWLQAFPGITYERLVRTAGDILVAAAEGEWSGAWPVSPTDPIPRPRHPVAYVLTDPDGQPAYVGSTDKFLNRMRNHHRDGRNPASWWAVSCTSREEAYRVEQRLIDQLKPYLNQRQAVAVPSCDHDPVQPPPTQYATPDEDPVGVGGYWRTRFGNQEFVRTHRRSPRSTTPGGYKKRDDAAS